MKKLSLTKIALFAVFGALSLSSCKKDDALKDLSMNVETASYTINQGQNLEIAYKIDNVGKNDIDVEVHSSDSKYAVTTTLSATEKNSGTIVVAPPQVVTSETPFTVTLNVSDAAHNRALSQIYNITPKLDDSFVKITDPANCYVVAPGSIVMFPASIGNSADFANFTDVNLIWQDAQSLVSSLIALPEQNAIVAVLGKDLSGNALVGATKDGAYVWNWHLWVSDFDPDKNVLTYKSSKDEVTYKMMDRNVGAMGNSGTAAFGNFFQDIRKEPIPTISEEGNPVVYNINNEEVTIEVGSGATELNNFPNGNLNPTTFYRGNDNRTGNYGWFTNDKTTIVNFEDYWGGVSGKKTVNDPCPAGWRVAPVCSYFFFYDAVVEGGLTRTKVYDADGTAYKNMMGYNVSFDGGTTNFFFPLQGEINNSGSLVSYYNGTNTWPCGKMWVAEVDPVAYRGSGLSVSPSSVSFVNKDDTYNGMVTSYGVAVRCVKE